MRWITPIFVGWLLLATARGVAEPAGYYDWPLRPRPAVVRVFDKPEHDWLPGHRGVDLAGTSGQTVLAAGDGIVVFAGVVAGKPVVSIDHAGGLRTTYEPVRAAVEVGRRVGRGAAIGTLESGHAGCAVAACLHWGLRREHDYLDPLGLIHGVPLRLKPVARRHPARSRPVTRRRSARLRPAARHAAKRRSRHGAKYAEARPNPAATQVTPIIPTATVATAVRPVPHWSRGAVCRIRPRRTLTTTTTDSTAAATNGAAAAGRQSVVAAACRKSTTFAIAPTAVRRHARAVRSAANPVSVIGTSLTTAALQSPRAPR